MAKIVSIRKSKGKKAISKYLHTCSHKQVIAYTCHRTVHCAVCGALLDPFDVLVDMLKGYIPPDETDHEGKLLAREMKKRMLAKPKKS